MGLFRASKSQSTASGAANTPTNLTPGVTIGGGGVSNNDGVRIEGVVTAFQASATFDIKLDDVVLGTLSLASGETRAFGVTVMRNGALGAVWRMDDATGTNQGANSGFSWSSAQDIQVVGTSPEEGGAVLQYFGVNW